MVGETVGSGEYNVLICFISSSDGCKFKLSNNLTFPPMEQLVNKVKLVIMMNMNCFKRIIL